MKIKSFGCSFIFGSDLADDGRHEPLARPSQLTYPALIAAKTNRQYSCHARPGAGNFEIANRIMNELATDDPAIYVINWTWIDRFSYIDLSKSTPLHPYNPMGWSSIMPIDTDQKSRIYYRDLHSQLRDTIETLTVIKATIDCLRQTNHEFIMTWTDPLVWEDQYLRPPAVCWLQNQVKPYLCDFEGQSFLEWSRKRQFAISDTLHPLESAHEAAAEHLLVHWAEYIRS